MQPVSMLQAKSSVSRLVEAIEQGQEREIVIARNGRPAARLVPGKPLGQIIQIPELAWAAQAVPHYDYLLADPEPAALLAGGHCIPLRVPQVARLVWHKLYSAAERRGFPEKAAKDRLQAATLAAALTEHAPETLREAFRIAPKNVQTAARAQHTMLEKLLITHAETRDLLTAAMD